jgi:transcriptional regulator with XRE-family HTH domain
MTKSVFPKTGFTIQAGTLLLGDIAVAKTNSTDTIGHRITRCRKERGMTQKELAAALKVSQPVVSDYENDVIRLPADMVILLADTLDSSADELLGLKPRTKSVGIMQNRRLSRRLQKIDDLPKRDQEALFRTIDAFISKA